ncbi:bacteriohemerythrin [bacterium]|nr:bacteriohemerythrin [bacterium]MCB2201975.1 bacteriohemerythrin [bacterium]
MAFIEWQDEYNTYLPRIDQQHQALVTMINELQQALQEGRDHEEIGRVINGLVDYTIGHFREEEEIMARLAPSFLDNHCKFHQAFTEWISDQLVKWGLGEPVDTSHLLEYLRWWLLDHIVCEDGAWAKAAMKSSAPAAARK